MAANDARPHEANRPCRVGRSKASSIPTWGDGSGGPDGGGVGRRGFNWSRCVPG
jgi:hypothetical protein